jgi:predicted nucleic acid-binding protein
MKIYLDNCVLNRPFDDLSQERIRLEAEAVILILSRLERKEWTWLGSQVLEIEIERTPNPARRSHLQRVAEHIGQSIQIGKKEEQRARALAEMGFISFDAVHLACAESGRADVFLTTDDHLLRLAKRYAKQLQVKVENPLDWIKEML